MALWTIGCLVVLAIVAGLALQWAISHNGAAVLDTADRLTGGSRSVELVEQAKFGDAEKQKLIIYADENRAKDAAARPVIIFVHGGSWNWGDPDDYGFIARALVPEGFVVVLAGYRLHPDVQYPAMLEDTAGAIAWTKANIAQHGGDPDSIILAGHSAGAYNAVMSALDPQWLEAEGLSASAIKGVIGLAGPYDFYPFDSDSTIASFGDYPDPEATQPINAVREDAPPMLLIHGEKDTLVYPRNSRVLAKALASTGNDARAEFFAEMDHNRPLMAFASPYRRDPAIVTMVAEFAQSAASKPKRPKQAEQTSVSVQAETR